MKMYVNDDSITLKQHIPDVSIKDDNTSMEN